ncbi:hypothetical protein [Litorimonas sp.]|jgi:hypothetical protein|uniref:hypothetical protein n=1 Tax=Litorimonas sp. TaxID=1892381 RepID=UPI003A8BDB43
MKVQEGPAFGALIIGMGLAFLINRQSENLVAAIIIGVLVGLADYFLLIWIGKFKERNK